VHLGSLGHPVVGDALYGAPRQIVAKNLPAISLSRNFLHAAEIQFTHPRTGEALSFSAPIPEQLDKFLNSLK
jgi:23S rRNA-/tRNA-specific pseudouridylate synthase